MDRLRHLLTTSPRVLRAILVAVLVAFVAAGAARGFVGAAMAGGDEMCRVTSLAPKADDGSAGEGASVACCDVCLFGGAAPAPVAPVALAPVAVALTLRRRIGRPRATRVPPLRVYRSRAPPAR